MVIHVLFERYLMETIRRNREGELMSIGASITPTPILLHECRELLDLLRLNSGLFPALYDLNCDVLGQSIAGQSANGHLLAKN